MTYAKHLTEIEIQQLWAGRKHIKWHLDPEVNILSGVNGIGKSTILHRIVSGVRSVHAHSNDGITIKTFPEDAELIRFDLITTPDVRSEYDINLDSLTERFASFNHEATRLKELYDLIDKLFEASEKNVCRDDFSLSFIVSKPREIISRHKLSSGEKQMLSILLTTYLEDHQPTVLFMDEPEVSLHIEWQQHLIESIRALNPNVQLILTTHSPAVIMQGWMDKVINVCDITLRE